MPEQRELHVGRIYRIVWPTHYNTHKKTVGWRGEFLRWRDVHCSLHGDFIRREALFQRVKESGRRGVMFGVDPGTAVITEDMPHA